MAFSDVDANENPNQSKSWVFYLIQMFLSFGQNLSYQFLPIYTRKQGANEIEMGLLTSLGNIFSTLFSPLFGKYSDTYGRKQFIAMGGLFAFGAAIAIAMADNATQVIIAAALNAFGFSILMPAFAGAMADYTDGKSRGGFIGRMMGVGSGFVTICLVIFALGTPLLDIPELEQYRLIMWISAINFLLVALVSYLFLDVKMAKKSGIIFSVWAPLKDFRFRRFLLVILVWWLFMSFAWSYFPIIMTDILDLTPSQVAWTGIMQTVMMAIAAYKGADLIDRWGAKKSVIIGFLPFSLVPLFFATATEWWHLLIPQFIGGLGIGFGFAALQVYILNIAGSEKAGTYQGVYNISFGVLTFFGSLFGGVFLTWYKEYTGSLEIAITHALIAIAIMRFFTNFLMVAILPSDK